MQRVIVGLSGGVDSAVAAYLLKQAGYDVIGITLRTWESSDGEESRCCEMDDARAVAWSLGIPYYTLNCERKFQDKVIRPFIREYLCGRTPNPCVFCNPCIKWERLLYLAGGLKAEGIATGHYASVIQLKNGRYTLKVAKHGGKDQTYMLYRLTQEQLARTFMPLGKLEKQEVREIARQAKLKIADKAESQEICFVPSGNYADYIAENAGEKLSPKGFFLDENGRRIGRHEGIYRYTVGQRKGLGLSLGYPAYVKEIRADRNEIVIGREDALYRREILCRDLNFMGIPDLKMGENLCCTAKIRYHHAGQRAVLRRVSEDCVSVVFEEPVRAATPGQSAVFYTEDGCILGGGVICADV